MANILGINLSELDEAAALKKAEDFLNSPRAHYIVTPNPEIILRAHQDEEFFYILNKADISLADGVGVKIAAWLMSEKVHRITGADFSLKLLALAAAKGFKTLILNWADGLSKAEEISLALKNKYPDLNFLVLDINKEVILNIELVKKINNYAPKLVFNTLGFPIQEKFMYHNINRLPSVRLMIAVGGSFDFISGKIKRAPKFMRDLGLEWFWRLINAGNYNHTSKRIKRIFNATFIFIIKVLKSRFINPYFYRANVACFLFKKENGKIKVLLVERTDEKGHWQLPQGGTDGENLATAVARELREETGVKNLITRAIFKNVSSYIFPKVYQSKEHKTYKFDYRGQKQGLYVAEFQGRDDEIVINFWDHSAWQWVDLSNVLNIIHPVRQKAFRIFLEKVKTLDL